jgi:transcriptional regulator with XRE-family HTH domain
MKNRIRELRQQMNLTQQELAEKAKIGYRTISDYERGVSTPDAESLKNLANVFNVSVDYLLGNTDKPNAIKLKVADADGTITGIEYELLNKVKGFTTDDLEKVLDYVDYIKSKKEEKKDEK